MSRIEIFDVVNEVIIEETKNIIEILDTGIQGPPGEEGAKIISVDIVGDDIIFTLDDSSTVTLVDGRKDLQGINWQGTWAVGEYQINDAVYHNNSAWIAVNITTEEPSEISSDWDLLVKTGLQSESTTSGVNNITVYADTEGKIVKDSGVSIDDKEDNLTFSTGLTRATNTITTNDAEINHNALSNKHNLTTDIDHDSITNTHNLTTDIDHDSITNTHNLTTDIDHNTIENTHNLTTDIDHNTIENTHNLTTDIDHNTINNYSAAEHVDWAVSQLTDIHPDNYTNTTYTSDSFKLEDLNDVTKTAKGEGKILKVDSAGNHVYVDDETGTDEKVKYDNADPTAGYIADKIIAGTGITVAEGTAGNENKLVVTNDDLGSGAVSTHESSFTHTDIALNTSDRHSAVTVTDSSEIDFTLTGQDITASLNTGSIDVLKLDDGVQTSLGKADSALQTGDNISELTNDSGFTTNTGTVTSVSSANTDIDVANGTTTPTITLNAATSGENKIVRLTAAGLLDESIMPPLSIIDTHVVASEVAQLDLDVQKGDLAIRTDLNKTYINKTGNNITMSDWEQLLFPSGGGSVTAVQAGNGMDFTDITTSGNVVLGTPDTLTDSTTNAVSTTSHTHQVTGFEPTITKNTAFNNNFETSTTNIKMNGTVSVGSSSNIPRADHVHAVDTSRASATDLSTHTGDSTIHFTQASISIPASQISDFDTEVANNTAVSLNTAKVTNATHTGDVTGATDLTIANKQTLTASNGVNITNTPTVIAASTPAISLTYGTTANTVCQGNDSRLSDSRTPTSHVHGNISNTGAIGTTANLPLITTTSGAVTTGTFGTGATNFCVGNDSRLSDSRTPTAHTHAGGDITSAVANATTAANCSRQVINGNGMNFTGGQLNADRTITLGTPSSLTDATTNAVTTNSHTHQITGFLPLTGGTITGKTTISNANYKNHLMLKRNNIEFEINPSTGNNSGVSNEVRFENVANVNGYWFDKRISSAEGYYIDGVRKDTIWDNKADGTHTHGNVTNDGKIGTAANIPLITGTGGVVTTGAFGTGATNFCVGNDSRLSDARTPTTHTHGQISNTGAVTTNVTVANTDRILITDASDSSVVKGGSAFGTGTTTYLRNDGAWGTPANTTYSEISTEEIDAGTASNLRTISGRRAAYIISKSTSNAVKLTGITFSGTVDNGNLVTHDGTNWVRASTTLSAVGMKTDTTEITLFGYVSGLSGLTPGKFYAQDGYGLSEYATGQSKVGFAISSSVLLLDIDLEGNNTNMPPIARGVFGGGYTISNSNTIDYITIATTGNATDFGNLTQAKRFLAACSNSTRGVFGGGVVSSAVNTIDYITIATTGNATDFGNLTQARSSLAACSNAHGGL